MMRRTIAVLLSLASCAAPRDTTSQAYDPETSGASEGATDPGGTSSDGATTDGGESEEGEAASSSAPETSGDPSTSSSEGTTGEPLPEFDDIPWEMGDEIGYGIAYKDLLDPNAHNVFIGYAGYPFPLDASQSWVRELWLVRLRELGVRHVWAVQGPATVGYVDLEIGNSYIAERLTSVLDEEGKVIVAAHSSGSYVAHELLDQLQSGLDPAGVTADKLVYFNLDGGTAGLYDAAVQRLHRAYFVGIYDGATDTASPNLGAMQYLDSMWHANGGYLELDGNGSGCNDGAPWCLHMVAINARPHDPWDSSVDDYYDFVDRPVVTAYIDMVADDAGISP